MSFSTYEFIFNIIKLCVKDMYKKTIYANIRKIKN